VKREEKAIQTDIFLHGPVVATMALYEGFVLYKSGITNIITLWKMNLVSAICVSRIRVECRFVEI